MEDLSLHILDIAENSIRAQAANIRIAIDENWDTDRFVLEIQDDGRGMDNETLNRALDPFFSTKKTRRFGLGLSLLADAARAANGHFHIDSTPGKGTIVRASFQASHIDRQPLGDIPQTLITLIMGHPDIDFLYTHTTGGSSLHFDTKDIRKQLEDIPLNHPEVIALLKKTIQKEFNRLRREQ